MFGGELGAETMIVAAPLFPSLVAVIVAVPTVPPVTIPAWSTGAIVPFVVVQRTSRPVSALPAASRGVATRARVALVPICVEAGVTDTEATGTGVTVTAA